MITRRNLCAGLALAIAAPYVVRNSGVLMPVRERWVRMPLNYIVALQNGPCPDGGETVVRYPAGTILPYIGETAPEGWRLAKVRAPTFYAKKTKGGWDIQNDWADLKDKIGAMHKFAIEQNVFASGQKDYI